MSLMGVHSLSPARRLLVVLAVCAGALAAVQPATATTVEAVAVDPAVEISAQPLAPAGAPNAAVPLNLIVRNNGGRLVVSGRAEFSGALFTTTTVKSWWVALDARGANGTWTTLGGAAASASGYTPRTSPPATNGLTVGGTPVPQAGVTYPGGNGDQAVGTRIDGFPTAMWNYSASLSRSASQLAALLSSSSTTQVRIRIHMEGRRVGLFGATADVERDQSATIGQMVRSQSGLASAVVATLRASGQANQVFTGATTPPLAAVAPGEQVVIPTTVTIPGLAPKGVSETDAAYRARLQAAVAESVSVGADATYLARGSAAQIPFWPLPDLDPPYILGSSRAGSATAANSTIGKAIPIVAVIKTGPSDIAPGETANYRITTTNSGNVAGTVSVVDAVTGIGSSNVPGFGSLAAGASNSADHQVAVPGGFADTLVTDKASAAWNDSSGNAYGPVSATVSTPIRTDTTPPAAPILTEFPVALSASRTASFRFSGEPGGRFDCRLDAIAAVACTPPTLYEDLGDGSHVFSVRQVDSAGNQGSWTAYAWTVDATSPAAPAFTSHPATASSSTTAEFAFSGEVGATFDCSLDGGSPAACASPLILESLLEGPHELAVTQRDAAGNQSPAARFAWITDTTAPAAPMLASTPAAVTHESTAGFGFTGEAGGSFECALDDEPFTTCANPQSYSSVDDGQHHFRVRQQDDAGNHGVSATFTWTVDSVPPDAPDVTARPPATSSSRDGTVDFAIVSGGSAECRLDSGPYEACASPYTVTNLADGQHIVEIRQRDAAGNVGPAAVIEWTVSSDAPVAPRILWHQDALVNWDFVVFELEGDEGNTLECQLDDAPFEECTTQPYYEGLSEGAHSFRVRQKNSGGTVGPEETFDWTTDYTPPEPPVFTFITDEDFTGNEIVVSWEPSDGARMKCADSHGGDWFVCDSPFVMSGLEAGDYYENFSWEDLAGNSGYYDFKHWTVHTPVPPAEPTITSAPSGLLTVAGGVVEFTLPEATTAECAIDASEFAPCESPFSVTDLEDGQHVVSVRTVDERALRSSVVSAAWSVDTTPPDAPTIVDGPSGEWAFTGANLSFTGESSATFSCRLDDAPFSVCRSPRHFGLLDMGEHSFSVRQFDVAGHASPVATRTWTTTVSPETAEPAAPPLEENGVAPFAEQVGFLYDGPDAIQDVPDPAVFTDERVSVIRGTVKDATGQPVAGVRVSVVDHPEFGVTQSRDTGEVYLAVNGGGQMTVRFERDGVSTVDRSVNVPWRDYAFFDDVVLTPLDTTVSEVSLDSPSEDGEIAEGSTVVDEDGVRKLGVVFPEGVTAQMAMPDGSLEPLSDLNVRLTEFTVGESGPDAMPAALPPTSGYTYAADLTVDQALSAGAKGVKFSEPVYAVLENFRQIPAGTIMPQGYYDHDIAAWKPEPNGRVMKVLSVEDGRAVFEDGNGQPLAAPGQGDLGANAWDEITKYVAERFDAGDTLWLVPMNHFSAVDINLPGGGGGDLPPGMGGEDGNENDPCLQKGSIVECENQTLGESIDIPGTDMSLNYRSDRAPGRTTKSGIDIPLTSDTVPDGLESVELSVSIAGTQLVRKFPAEPNQSFRFDWNGMDWAGRALTGSHPAVVSVGYAFPGYMLAPDTVNEDSPAWAKLGTGEPIVGSNGGIKFHTARSETVVLQAPDVANSRLMEDEDIGGWSLSSHDRFDPLAQTTIHGDGGSAGPEPADVAVERFAGLPLEEWPDDHDDDEDPDDNLIGSVTDPSALPPVASAGLSRIVRSVLTAPLFAAVGQPDDDDPFGVGDGGPATKAVIDGPTALAKGPDGSTVFYDNGVHRIRRIAPDGTISSIAGSGVEGNAGDGGPAMEARIQNVLAIAIDGFGNTYFSQDRIIRKIDVFGTITRYAGNGEDSPWSLEPGNPNYRHDGKALGAGIGEVRGLAVSPADGLLYMTGNSEYLVRRVEANGDLTSIGDTRHPWRNNTTFGRYIMIPYAIAINSVGTVFVGGSNIFGFLMEIDPATFKTSEVTNFTSGNSGGIRWNPVIHGLAVSKEDRLYILERDDHGPETPWLYGAMNRVFQWEKASGLKRVPTTIYDWTSSIATDSEGELFFSGQEGLHRYGPALPDHLVGATSIPARDGETAAVFDAYGRHRETRSTMTNAVSRTFGYDAGHRLSWVADGFGNRTTIERNAQGDPTAIVAPFGQRTELAIGPNHLLSGVTEPGGAASSFTYDNGGLMKSFTRPSGATSRFTYDSRGLLTRDEDALGGYLSLTKQGSGDDRSVEIGNARGRLSTNRVQRLPDGSKLRTIDSVSAGASTRLESVDGGVVQSNAALTATVSTGTDQRFGAAVRTPLTQSLATPGGLVLSGSRSNEFDLSDWSSPSSWNSQQTTAEQNGNTWVSTFAKSTGSTTEHSPEGRSSSATFNSQMQVTHQASPGLAGTEYEYDSAGRLTATISGDRVARFSYDAQGNLDSMTDPVGHVVQFAHDSRGRVTQAQLPGGRSVGYSYDSEGNVTSISPPGRAGHATLFDLLGNITGATSPALDGVSAGTTFVRGGADHELTKLTRPSGRDASFNYDAAGRVSSIDTPDGVVDFDYDAPGGNPSHVETESGQVTDVNYDGELPTSVTQSGPVDGAVSVDYDNSFRPARVAAGDTGFSYSYDRDSLLQSVGDLSISHGAETGLISGTQLDNVHGSVAYNQHAEPLSTSTTFPNGGEFGESFVRDKLGRITEKTVQTTDGSDQYSYSYDDAGHLSTVTRNGTQVESYSYDENSNRLSGTTGSGASAVTRTASINGRDQLTSYGNLSLSYNVDGDMTEKHNEDTGETVSLRYTTLGALRGATVGDDRQLTYVTDGLGNRVGKREDGHLVQGFLYSPGMPGPVAELDAQGDVRANFAYGTRAMTPDYMVKNGTRYRLVTDQVGSVRMVIDAESGSVEQELEYDSYGRVISDSNPGFQPFGFGGGIYDRDTRLTHFGAREYDAELGRWTSPDPSGFLGSGTNLYAYSVGDPVNFVDPTGQYGVGDLWNDVRGTVSEIPNSFASGATRDYFLNYSAGVYHTATFGLADSLIGINPDCMGRGFGFGELMGYAIPIGGIGRGANAAVYNERLFGRGYQGATKGIFNRGPVRVGWGWNGKTGRDTFRVSVGKPGNKIHSHWDFPL